MYYIIEGKDKQTIIPALARLFKDKIKMSPHENKYEKTKEGYLIEVEDRLGLLENLPKEFYRIKIHEAAAMLESVIVSGRTGFEYECYKLGLKTEGLFNET